MCIKEVTVLNKLNRGKFPSAHRVKKREDCIMIKLKMYLK